MKTAHVAWHMTCERICRAGYMATKIKMLTLLQERRGYAELTNRLPVLRPGVLFLMKLRARTAQKSDPKRRISIVVDTNGNANVPLPIKINHIGPASHALRAFVR
jgi:hypothetical protein